MYTKINMPKGLNSGSCKSLADYLDKEEKGFFFDKNDSKVSSKEIIKEIDNAGKKGIRKSDDKFYMLSFSPSGHELKQMVGRDVSDIHDLSFEEKTRLFSDLRSFTHHAMDLYAQNFSRDTVNGKDDLLYFGRIETQRTLNLYDKEVKEGKGKVGDKKSGLNFHIHVIVSRKSADGKVMLSPNIRFRNKEFKQGNNEKMVRGFDYTNFTTKCHDVFKAQFNINYKNNFNYTHDKGFCTAGNKVLSQAKQVASSYILQGEMQTEQKMLGNVQQGANIMKGFSNGDPKSAFQGKNMLQNAVLQGELKVERKMIHSSMQAASLVKTMVQLTNPVTAPTELAKKIFEIAKKVHQLTITITK